MSETSSKIQFPRVQWYLDLRILLGSRNVSSNNATEDSQVPVEQHNSCGVAPVSKTTQHKEKGSQGRCTDVLNGWLIVPLQGHEI